MASTKGRIVRLLSGFALERATIVASENIGRFKRLQLRSSVGVPAPGTKVQLLLPSDDMRTFTPVPSSEGMVLLGWMHGDGPAARWLANARAGDELPFVGPQRSLEIETGPVVLVGDETSIAVAAAYALNRPDQVHAVIQSNAASEVHDAAGGLGLDRVDMVARADTAATVSAVMTRLASMPDAVVALTGGSGLVVAVREALREGGVRNIKTKTYWIPGRTGLD
jgi:NADPH-dependent ferric siderophore reductase